VPLQGDDVNERQARRWAKIRASGRDRFIWIHGVFGWGVPTGILVSLVLSLLNQWEGALFYYMSLSLILFSIGGYFWGLLIWQISEKQYLQIQQQTSCKGTASNTDQDK
jgi:hypothetical protein